MIRAIIVDDEEHARNSIEKIIRQSCADVQLVAQAHSVKTGVAAIRKHKPELLFLDIGMADGTGFDILCQLSFTDFKVIFITAFHEFAIKAFRFSAIDYILKPVIQDDLVLAIKKVVNTLQKDNFSLKYSAYLANTSSKSECKKIVVSTTDSYHVINVNDIIRCEADGNYTVLHLINDSRFMATRTLKEFEELLNEQGFFRVHKSHIINVAYIQKCDKSRDGVATMIDNSCVPVSPLKKGELLEILSKL